MPKKGGIVAVKIENRDLREKAHEEKQPFLQNMINLHFRMAFLESKEDYNENPYQKWRTIFKKRFKRDFTQIEQYYWDVLFEINVKGKKMEDIIQISSQYDPDKEAWIKNELNDPSGAFKNSRRIYFT